MGGRGRPEPALSALGTKVTNGRPSRRATANSPRVAGTIESEGESIIAAIEQDRDEHRAHPDLWLIELSTDLWSQMGDGDAIHMFRMRVKGAPWWALQVIECLELVLRERPYWGVPNLIEGCERGEWLGPGEDEEPYYSWIAEQLAPMKAVYEAVR